MRKTLLSKAVESGKAQGLIFIGTVNRGLGSMRKGSNIRKFCDDHNLVVDNVVIIAGARAGRYRNDGYQWAIFTS